MRKFSISTPILVQVLARKTRYGAAVCSTFLLWSVLLWPAEVLAHPHHAEHGTQLNLGLSHGFFHVFDVLQHSAWLSPELARGLDVALLSLGLFLVFARSRHYAALDFRRFVGAAAVLLALSRGVI